MPRKGSSHAKINMKNIMRKISIFDDVLSDDERGNENKSVQAKSPKRKEAEKKQVESPYIKGLSKRKPKNVKPQIKILENYEAKSPTEINIILESLILDKREKEKNEAEDSRPDIESPEKDMVQCVDQEQHGEMLSQEEGEQNVNEEDSQEIETKAKVLPTKLTKDSEKINITFWDYVRSYLWKSKEMKEKMGLLHEGVRRIEERLDIFNVLKKFREVDKLKLLLLENEQLVLFDTLPKPELAPKKDDSELKSLKSTIQLKESKFISEKRRNDLIALSYEGLKRKQTKTMIDERLLDIYDDIADS